MKHYSNGSENNLSQLFYHISRSSGVETVQGDVVEADEQLHERDMPAQMISNSAGMSKC